MAPNPLAVWAKEHNVEYDDSKLAWALFGHIAAREDWFARAIESWKQEELDWMDEKKKIAEALRAVAMVARDQAAAFEEYGYQDIGVKTVALAEQIEKKALKLVEGL